LQPAGEEIDQRRFVQLALLALKLLSACARPVVHAGSSRAGSRSTIGFALRLVALLELPTQLGVPPPTVLIEVGNGASAGLILNYMRRAEEAIESALTAMGLNPHYPEWYVMQLGPIYYDARRYKDAIEIIESLRNFETIWTDFYLAARGLDHTGERSLQGSELC
jgi:hypothetical protein